MIGTGKNSPTLKAKVVAAIFDLSSQRAKIKEDHIHVMIIHIRTQGEDLLPELFRGLESIKKLYDLEDYQLSEIGLEEILIQFAKRGITDGE